MFFAIQKLWQSDNTSNVFFQVRIVNGEVQDAPFLKGLVKVCFNLVAFLFVTM